MATMSDRFAEDFSRVKQLDLQLQEQVRQRAMLVKLGEAPGKVSWLTSQKIDAGRLIGIMNSL